MKKSGLALRRRKTEGTGDSADLEGKEEGKKRKRGEITKENGFRRRGMKFSRKS